MRRSLLDRYRQGASPVHRLDPRLKLLATLAFVLVVTTTPAGAWVAFGLLVGLVVTATLSAEVPLVEGIRRSAIALPFAGMVAISLPFVTSGNVIWSWSFLQWTLIVTDAGLLLFATVVVKAWLSIMASGLLVATTPFTDLLKAMHSLHAPAVLTSTISFMYRYLFVLVDEAMRLQTARAARSAGSGRTVRWRARVLGGMVGSLFIRSYERSERTFSAMLSRGFSGKVRSLTHLSWQARDTWVALAWLVSLATIAALGRASSHAPSWGLW